jgi:protein N-terminal methyltransferase
VGAGVGRVTAKTLLPLFSDVVLLEPVKTLLDAAASQGTASKTHSRNDSKLPYEKRKWRGIADFSKSVTFLQGTLQACDPARPLRTARLLLGVASAIIILVSLTIIQALTWCGASGVSHI